MNKELLSIACKEKPAELLLANARIVNVFTGRVEEGNVAIAGGRIAGVGDYRQAEEVLDLEGKYLLPGLLDGHVHLESSLLHPREYARAVVPRGVLGVVTDLHEIANVCGLEGIRWVLACAEKLPLDIFVMAPSCVPATNLETSGAVIDLAELEAMLDWPQVIGLGEVMNYPGVVRGETKILEKIRLFRGRLIDGHAPGLRGEDLNAYLAAGIFSDHECTALEEAREKLSRGMWLMIREGTSAKNLEALLPLVDDRTYGRCFFVVDDRSCADLLQDGDVDGVVRKAMGLGLDPVRAIRLATLNPAEYFRLAGLGAIAPGYWANLMVVDDLSSLQAKLVFYRGKLVAQEGQPIFEEPAIETWPQVSQTVRVKPFDIEALRIPARGETFPVIEVIPGQILTRRRDERVREVEGFIEPDPERDILKLIVVERHKASGNIGRGLVRGFGLKRGALASSVAHDSHNLVAVGAGDRDILQAIKELERLQGGLVVVAGGRVISSLPLPLAGLLSNEPLKTVAEKLARLEQAASDLGCSLPSPFSVLSFLALPVIPELRLTDRGLVDVTSFKLLEGVSSDPYRKE